MTDDELTIHLCGFPPARLGSPGWVLGLWSIDPDLTDRLHLVLDLTVWLLPHSFGPRPARVHGVGEAGERKCESPARLFNDGAVTAAVFGARIA